jgi:hypothetical protein
MTLTLANYEDYIARPGPEVKILWKDIVDVIRESIVRYQSDPGFVEAGTKLLPFYSLLDSGAHLPATIYSRP